MLNHKICLVTGASRGIGKSIAENFLKAGATVIGTASKDVDFDHPKLISVKVDVNDIDATKMLFQKIFKEFSKLHVLVNNAGILIDQRIGMISKSTIDQVIDTNLKSVITYSQNAVRLMKQGGSIINMASIIGRVGNVGQMVYGASKAGVIGATLSAAKELGSKGIRVNAIAPGFIETDMTKHFSQELINTYCQNIPLGRLGKVQDIANLALFLACDQSSYITGQVIGVDGGWII